MALIQLHTEIKAPAERCFLLSLSVDLHTASTGGTGERAVAGITSGIMKMDDVVTWEAVHFGIRQKLTTKISAYSCPGYFVSEMQEGTFKKIYHRHIFQEEAGITRMTDLFEFEAPFGILGKMAENLFLANYMKKFLVGRNQFIKKMAEGTEWKKYLL